MNTFFCRHSSSLDINDETLNHLWENDYLAVHYPFTTNGNKDSDSESKNPQDYSGSARKTLNALQKLALNGGYVFGVYQNRNEYKIGFIEPKSEIELIKGQWGNKNGLDGRNAILKGLKITKSKIIDSIDALSLTCAQPRQGTLCVWNKVGNRVEIIVNGIIATKTIDDLTPDLQEVLCSEFLRTGLDPILPKLECFLTPIGRTMKDVDIAGLSTDGKKVLVQVTHDNKPQWKIDRLQKYKNENCDLILFCKNDKIETIDGVLIYPINEAFNKFESTSIGGKWISLIK